MKNTNSIEFDPSIAMAKRLKELRLERGLSYEALSQLLSKRGTSLSHDSLQNYETSTPNHTKYGKNLAMRADSLLALAQLYGVSTDYLLCVTDIRSPNPNVAEMVDYLGISEDNICFLHALNQKTVVANRYEKILHESVLSKEAPVHLKETFELIDVLSFASPGSCKIVVDLIDKLISTIGENFYEVLRLYHIIEESAQHLLNNRKDHISPYDVVANETLSVLKENGFLLMDTSWILKRSWEDLMGILHTGVAAKVEREIDEGKRSIGNYELANPRQLKLNPNEMKGIMLDSWKNVKAYRKAKEKK